MIKRRPYIRLTLSGIPRNAKSAGGGRGSEKPDLRPNVDKTKKRNREMPVRTRLVSLCPCI